MNTEPTTRQPQLPFEATLSPHRSLSRPAFLILMAAIVVSSAISGALFFIAGAWPVTFFFAVDVALIVLAFRWNFADARCREVITVSHEEVRLTQIDRRGDSRYKTFDPTWVRLSRVERTNGTVELAFAMRNERTRFGAFLTDEERARFADVLAAAMLEARGGVRI